MKVYTKTGDKGQTSLIGGERIKKNDLRLEIYGTIDELDSFIGLLKHYCSNDFKFLEHIQKNLFIINCCFAISEDKYFINSSEIDKIEKEIDSIQTTLPPLTSFLIPGSSKPNAVANVCRTICRRCERRIYDLPSLNNSQQQSAIYINRLSDYFFVLGRKYIL